MDINFELYKVFYHVAKTLSFSEAARELYISQSAVSQAVRVLEDKMHCQLFVRSTKQVRLSREGELLFKHVEQAYNLIRAGERSLHESFSLKQGEVLIGASDTICKYHLLPYFENFSRLYPQIKMRVTNRPSPECIRLLRKGSVDVAVVNLPPALKNGKDLTVRKFTEVRDVFIAGRAFDSIRDKKIELSELTQYPLLLLEKDTTTRNFIDGFLEKKGITLAPEIELESVDLLVELAKIGLGISFVADSYIKKELAAEEIFILNIKEKIPARNLGIVTSNSIPVPAAAQKFIELMEKRQTVRPA